MEPFYHETDEKLRLKRDDRKRKFTVGTFIDWWLIPGFIGMLITVFFVKFVVAFAAFMTRNEPLQRGVRKIGNDLNEEIMQLIALEWDKTNLWLVMLFGFILGVFLKYAYSDKKVY
jgi:ribose/xylose/arabinose/galactoside ABC-type transport system permease subunit